MKPRLKIYDSEGELHVTVTLEFWPMVQIEHPDSGQTDAMRKVRLNDINNRLGYLAKHIEREMENMTLEELEERFIKAIG